MGNAAPDEYDFLPVISYSSQETENSSNETSSNDATSENENNMFGWVGNKDWCKCGEYKREIGEMLCLKKTILKINLVGLHETHGDSLQNDKDLQNKSLHFAAYKQFIFQHFDKGNRRVLSPLCSMVK